MANDWPAFVEIFARRNVVTHAGGATSLQYVRTMEALKYPSIPDVGDDISPSKDYLEVARQTLLSFGLLLIVGCWLQFRASAQGETIRWVTSRIGMLLDLGYDETTIAMTSTILATSRNRLPRSAELSLRINNWVARKRSGDFTSVRIEVAKWEVSGLDLQYSHARSVLLEEDDRAVAEINELRARHQLSLSEVALSPLYEKLRTSKGAELGLRGAEYSDASEEPEHVVKEPES